MKAVKSIDVSPLFRSIQKLHESGFIEKWFLKHYGGSSKCSQLTSAKAAAPIEVRGASGVFIITAVFYCLAFGTLAVELLVHHVTRVGPEVHQSSP